MNDYQEKIGGNHAHTREHVSCAMKHVHARLHLICPCVYVYTDLLISLSLSLKFPKYMSFAIRRNPMQEKNKDHENGMNLLTNIICNEI